MFIVGCMYVGHMVVMVGEVQYQNMFSCTPNRPVKDYARVDLPVVL